MSPDHPSYLDLRGSTLLAIPQIYLNPQELSGDGWASPSFTMEFCKRCLFISLSGISGREWESDRKKMWINNTYSLPVDDYVFDIIRNNEEKLKKI